MIANGADPWVIRSKDTYYRCHSGNGGVWVGRTTRLQDLGRADDHRVWTPPSGEPYSKSLWAPELHFLRDKWYIYVAADDGDNATHRMYVLEGTSSDPLAPFVLKGKITAPTDRWAIDGTVLVMPDNRLFFIWSGWEGSENAAQNLYLAPMSNPWTISGERVCISRPEHEWEKQGRPWVNEGPQVLWHDGKLFLIYSASGSWTDNYCLGQLAWSGGNVSDPKSWLKKPSPVFASTEQVFGPGHCSFVKSPDGSEDWIIYHAAKHRGSGWRRDIRMQRFGWNSDGSPDFGRPLPPGIPMAEPSGDSSR